MNHSMRCNTPAAIGNLLIAGYGLTYSNVRIRFELKVAASFILIRCCPF
jgi:hypothetical protein